MATITRASSKGGDLARLENAQEMIESVKSYTNISTDKETGSSIRQYEVSAARSVFRNIHVDVWTK